MKLDEVKRYVESGELKILVRECTIPFEHMKFVSITPDGTLTLFIGGKGPYCDSSVMSNVNNYKFCNNVLLLRLKILFPDLCDVKFISTHDRNIALLLQSVD